MMPYKLGNKATIFFKIRSKYKENMGGNKKRLKNLLE